MGKAIAVIVVAIVAFWVVGLFLVFIVLPWLALQVMQVLDTTQ